jgi:hypothetical protein
MKALFPGLLSMLTGCSLMFSRPPDPPRVGASPCKVSRAPAYFDAYNAIGGVLLSLWALEDASGDKSDSDAMGAIGGVTLAVSAAYAASAAYGFSNAARCHDQNERLVGAYPIAPAETPAVEVPPDLEIEGEVERVEDEETIQRRRTIYMRRR